MIPQLAPGTLLGAFEILGMIGRGGMGAVYHARNRITGDERAIKLMLPELARESAFVERFVREIRLAMAVDHPNLVRVFEPGMDGDRIFLPMELLVGEPLSEQLKRDLVVPPDEALVVIEAVGSALGALHAKGILHRDVKPSNVFLTSGANGALVPKLLDLGAGKEVEGTEEATATGLAVGSPHYMAPEQASGRKDLDASVDQYALGVLAYQLLTGARPYENDDTGHVLAKVLSGAPFKTPRQLRDGISGQLEAVVLRAMSRRREDRFRDVDEFVRAARGAWPGAAPVEENAHFLPQPAPVTQERSGTMQVSTVSVEEPTNTKPAVLGVLVGLAVVAVAGGVWFAGRPATSTAGASDSNVATLFSTPSSTPPPGTSPSPSPPRATASPAASAWTTVPTPPTVAIDQLVPAQPAVASASSAPPPPVAPAAHAVTAPPGRPGHTTPPRPAAPKDPGDEPCHPTPGAPCL
jgi:serine/threonine-protein kinase